MSTKQNLISRFFVTDNQEAALHAQSMDWSQHPLGLVEKWPAGLKIALGIIFNSKHPMFLFWGEESFCFYNDGYLPILSEEKHPWAMGKRGQEVWAEIWPLLTPQINSVMSEGKATWNVNQKMAIKRHGRLEEVYFTYSYSPAFVEDGTVGGVIVTTSETTGQVLAENELRRAEKEVVDALESMNDGFIALDKHFNVVRVNRNQERISGLSRSETIGKNHWDIHPKETIPKIWDAYHKVMREKVPVQVEDFNTALKIWVSISAFPTPDGGIAVFFRDMTKEKATARLISETKAEFETLADAIPGGIYIADSSGAIIYQNQRFWDYTGRSPDDADGWKWKDLPIIHPDDLPRTVELWKDAVNRGDFYENEYRLRRHDGEYRWFLTRAFPYQDPDGKIVRWFGTNTDINDARDFAVRLKESEQKLSLAFAAGQMGAWHINLKTSEATMSDKLKDIFKVDQFEKSVYDIINSRMHPDDAAEVTRTFEEAVRTRQPYSHEYRIILPGTGQVRWLLSQGQAQYDKDGAPLELSGIALDITERKLSQELLLHAKEEAERANQLKSSFLANMSHEIRTPLGAILGYTDLLKDKNLTSDERSQFLDTISRNGKALTKIIDDILDLAKVESGKLEIEHTEFSFFDLIDDVMDLFRERTRAKEIYLRANLGKDTPGRIISDPTRLRQILINIIGNAVKFTEKGGVSIEVVSIEKEMGKIHFQVFVKDTGIGISTEQKSRAFQPFMQADNTTTRKFGGTGLGLALSKRLANALSGDVTLQECNLNQGCTFIISFQAVLPSVVSVMGPSESSKFEGTEIPSGVRILVADDSKDNLFLMTRILVKQGAEIDTAENGADAFRKALAGKYDLVLMDIQMPEMDGYEATRALREAGFNKPIIALTAHAMAEERARSLAAGCNGHLTKPLIQKELLESIRNIVRSTHDVNNQHR